MLEFCQTPCLNTYVAIAKFAVVNIDQLGYFGWLNQNMYLMLLILFYSVAYRISMCPQFVATYIDHSEPVANIRHPFFNLTKTNAQLPSDSNSYSHWICRKCNAIGYVVPCVTEGRQIEPGRRRQTFFQNFPH